MSVKIRLSRHGAKKKPFYRIIVSDSRYPRDGRKIEQIGTYDPKVPFGQVKLDINKIESWLRKGAQPTQVVSELYKKAVKLEKGDGGGN